MPSKFGHSLSSDMIRPERTLGAARSQKAQSCLSVGAPAPTVLLRYESVFSRRSSTTFEPNRLSQALAQARASGAPLVDLTSGNPVAAGIPYDARVLAALA